MSQLGLKFNFRYGPKELAKATAVLLHAMYHHPLMLMALMFKNRDDSWKLCNHSTLFFRENYNLPYSYTAFSSSKHVEMSFVKGSKICTVMGLGKYSAPDGTVLHELSIPLLSEEEEFQQSLVLTDLEMYTLEYFRECEALNVPSVFIVLREFYRFLNEYEQLYHQLEKRYDEFYSSEHI